MTGFSIFRPVTHAQSKRAHIEIVLLERENRLRKRIFEVRILNAHTNSVRTLFEGGEKLARIKFARWVEALQNGERWRSESK